MKLHSLRVVLIVLIIVLGCLIGYQQKDAWQRSGEAKENAKTSPREGGVKDSSARAILKVPKGNETEPRTELTAAEKEQVAAAIGRFRKTLDSIERKNAKVVETFNSGANARLISLRLRAPTKEQVGEASESLSAQLASLSSGSPAWKEARRQGEEMLEDFNGFTSSMKSITTHGFGERVSILLATGVEESEVKAGEDGSINVTSDKMEMMGWEQGQKRYGHLFDAEGKPTVGP
jgi:hypothetical protein